MVARPAARKTTAPSPSKSPGKATTAGHESEATTAGHESKAVFKLEVEDPAAGHVEPVVAVPTLAERRIGKKGVKIGIYTRWIKDELEKESACLELPMTITLLVAFTFMALLFLQQPKISMVENAIENDIGENANFAWAHAFGHKGIEDVNSYADFWSWTRLGLLPLLTASWGYSEELAAAVPQQPGRPAYDVESLPRYRMFPGHRKAVPIRNDYLRHNRIVGGIRLRQQTAPASEDKCTFPSSSEVFKRWFGKPCSPSESGELPPDLQEAEEFSNGERVEWILTETGELSLAVQTLVDMEDGCSSAIAQNRTCLCRWCASQDPPMPWLNEMTSRVQISFVIMNPVHGVYSYAAVNFWFNRAGHIYKLISLRSAWMSLFARSAFENVVMVSAGLVWVLLCLFVIYSEAKEIVIIMGKSRKVWYHVFFEDYMGFWNLVDWTSIILALTINYLLLRMTFDTMSTNDALGEVALTSTSGAPSQQELLRVVTHFFNNVETMLDSESAFRFQLVLYPSCLMLRLFKSFAAQPRLAIMTETFVEAQSDIFHFFIVFFSVYFCMVVNAILFFGQDNLDFTTMDRAFHSCFLVMFGDWDYEQMEQIGRIKASLWFWTFMVIVVLVLQNIMLAILMEAYTVVKAATKDAPTLLSQIKKQYRRWREARQLKRVRLNDIFDALLEYEGGDEEAMLNNETIIWPDEVEEKVPNIKAAQAERTLRDSQKDYDKAHSAPFTTHVMSPNMDRVKARVDNLLLCSALCASKIKAYDAVERPTDGCGEADDPKLLKRSVTVEHTGAQKNEHAPDDDFLNKKSLLKEGLEQIRKITQKSTVELSDAMEAVLAEEMQGLERKQKEQSKAQEQMQASLQSLRALAYKVNATCIEVRQLTTIIAPPPPDALVIEADHVEHLAEELPSALALWENDE